GVRPPRVFPRASRDRPLAGAAARSRLGNDVPGRDAHRGYARSAVAPQARRCGRDPDRARRRLQARRCRLMPGPSLRSRLFQAIAVVVIICVALTIGVGLILTRRAVERATLKDVEHQADIIASIQSAGAGQVAIPDLLEAQSERLVRDPTIVPLPARD